jgi:hypothetical protein
MECNIGPNDKMLRIAFGVLSAVLVVFVSPWFLIITALAFVTASMEYSPLYALFGWSTRKPEQKQAESATPAKAKPKRKKKK